MSIKEFVTYVLKVPVHLNGYMCICNAIKYVVESDDPKFYKVLTKDSTGMTLRQSERNIRTAKQKSLENITEIDKQHIFAKCTSITNSEYICRAAQFYMREYKHENKAG